MRSIPHACPPQVFLPVSAHRDRGRRADTERECQRTSRQHLHHVGVRTGAHCRGRARDDPLTREDVRPSCGRARARALGAGGAEHAVGVRPVFQVYGGWDGLGGSHRACRISHSLYFQGLFSFLVFLSSSKFSVLFFFYYALGLGSGQLTGARCAETVPAEASARKEGVPARCTHDLGGRRREGEGAQIFSLPRSCQLIGPACQLYCQNLSLFGKLFIDIKTLFFDCDNCVLRFRFLPRSTRG